MGNRVDDISFEEARKAVPVLGRDLTAGMEGHDVARLQADLRRAGLGPGAIDGVFGERTIAAISEFAVRNALPAPNVVVDATLWAVIVRLGAFGRADAHEAIARAREQAAAAPQDAAADKRAAATPAGPEEELAATALFEASKLWRAAADSWLAAAVVLAPHLDPEGRGAKAHTRHLRALDLAQSLVARTVHSPALAGRDFDTTGVTDHIDRLAAATLEARAEVVG